MKILYECPHCHNFGRPDSGNHCENCGRQLSELLLPLVAARDIDASFISMPFTYKVTGREHSAGHPVTKKDGFFYPNCFAELLRLARSDVIGEQKPWGEYLNYLFEFLADEFSNNGELLSYLLCTWLQTVRLSYDHPNGEERRLVFAEALAIKYMYEARESGYRFDMDHNKPVGHDEIELITHELLSEKIMKKLLEIKSPLDAALYNPIMTTTLQCMPFRDESVENKLESFVTLNEKIKDDN